MKPEDRARLDAAIEHAETIVGSTHNIYEMRWIRGIIDEQDAEIARLKTQSENQARIIDTQRRLAQCGESKFEAENETLKEQRAEERAKREATVQEYERTCTSIERMRCEEKERADKAGRELDELNAYADARVGELMVEVSGWRQRAVEAERELAEERAAHARADAARANLRDKLDRLAAHLNGVADEVERWCVVAANWEGRAGKAEARVAELQALVDAGDTFRFGRFRVFPQYIAERGYRVEDEHGDWLAFDVPKQEAIALARDLAVKEKEPK